jgi:hypothetical protein
MQLGVCHPQAPNGMIRNIHPQADYPRLLSMADQPASAAKGWLQY